MRSYPGMAMCENADEAGNVESLNAGEPSLAVLPPQENWPLHPPVTVAFTLPVVLASPPTVILTLPSLSEGINFTLPKKTEMAFQELTMHDNIYSP